MLQLVFQLLSLCQRKHKVTFSCIVLIPNIEHFFSWLCNQTVIRSCRNEAEISASLNNWLLMIYTQFKFRMINAVIPLRDRWMALFIRSFTDRSDYTHQNSPHLSRPYNQP